MQLPASKSGICTIVYKTGRLKISRPDPTGLLVRYVDPCLQSRELQFVMLLQCNIIGNFHCMYDFLCNNSAWLLMRFLFGRPAQRNYQIPRDTVLHQMYVFCERTKENRYILAYN